MEEGAQRGVTAAFPPPPPFWRHFSRANLNKLEDAKRAARPDDDDEKRATSKDWTPAELQALDVAPELKYLIPPEPPTTDYVLFGETQQVRGFMISESVRTLVTDQKATALPESPFVG